MLDLRLRQSYERNSFKWQHDIEHCNVTGPLRSKHINSEMPESKTKGQRARKMIDLRHSMFTMISAFQWLSVWDTFQYPLPCEKHDAQTKKNDSISESSATPKDLGTCTKHLTSAILALEKTYHSRSSWSLDTVDMTSKVTSINWDPESMFGQDAYLTHRSIVGSFCYLRYKWKKTGSHQHSHVQFWNYPSDPNSGIYET